MAPSLPSNLKIVGLKFPATLLIREFLNVKSLAPSKVEIDTAGGFGIESSSSKGSWSVIGAADELDEAAIIGTEG